MAAERAHVLVEQLVNLAAAISEDLRGVLEELDLSGTLANVIWLLDPDAEPVPLRQLAGRLHCDPSNITLLADRLEEKGLAERRPHPADGRVRTLVLTAEGARARRKLLEHTRSQSPLAALDLEQQEQLHELLTTVLAARAARRTAR